MSEKSRFSWFKGKEKKKESVADQNRESKEWEASERSAVARTMNNVAESLYMALMGGPKNIEMRFQDFTLTKKDIEHLAKSLPREDEKTLVYLFKFLNSLDEKMAGDNPFYREYYGTSVKAQARAGLKEILSATVPPESMLPPKPKAFEQLHLEEVHWDLANKTRDRQLEEGEKKEQEIKVRGYRLGHEPVAFEWATDIYRYSKLLGRELSTPLTDTEVHFLNSRASFELEPRDEEVEKWEEDDEGNEVEAEPRYERSVRDARRGFSSLEKLVDAGVPAEKLATVKDETYEIIERDLERYQASEYNDYLEDSHLRMLSAMKKVAPDKFATLMEKFGKIWEEQTIKALPTSEENWFLAKYQMTGGEKTVQRWVDILEIFSDSPEIREAVLKSIKIDEKKGYSRNPNEYAEEELEKIKNPKESYDMSQFSHIIQQPLKIAYLRKTLVDKLAEPSQKV